MANYIESCRTSSSTKPVLDLLIISHFHADHINHLPTILADFEIKRVMLPYLTPDECLLAYCDFLTFSQETASEDSKAFIKTFLQGPVNYLKAQGIEAILSLHSGNPLNDTARSDNQSSVWQNRLVPLSTPPDTDSQHFSDQGNIELANMWSFKCYIAPNHAQSELTDFLAALQLELKLSTLNIDALGQKLNNASEATLLQIKKLYTTCFKTRYQYIKQTSIVLLHGPLNPSTVLQSTNGNLTLSQSALQKFNMASPALSLLTADAKFSENDVAIWLKSWSKHQSQLKQVRRLQIPHHGSAHNLSNRFLSLFPPNTQAIINYGLVNAYRHPNPSVIKILEAYLSATNNIVHNNDNQAHTYTYVDQANFNET